MNKVKFLRIGSLNDEQIRMHSLESTSHCVLVLIWYRIDLLLFVPTNRIVTF